MLLTREENETSGMLKIKEALKMSDKSFALKVVAYTALGFVSGLFPESYIVYPFSAAAVASSKPGFALWTYIGALTGCLVSRGFTSSVRYLIMLSFVLASRAVCEKRFLSLDKKWCRHFSLRSLFFSVIYLIW